jgi:hypothetical protein
MEQFLNAYPDLDKTLVGSIRAAVERYEDWDQEAREAAALAFAAFAEIPEQFRVKQPVRQPEEIA